MLLLSLALTLGQYDHPYKMTYASADPAGAQAFAEKYLGAIYTKQPHKGGDGECALVKWTYLPGSNGPAPGMQPYQLHFVKGYRRPNGTMTIDEFEDQMAALHSGMKKYDTFMDFHVTMKTSGSLDVFAAPMLRDGHNLLARYDPRTSLYSIFFEVPHAIVIELQGPKLTVLKAPTWDRCGQTPTRAPVDDAALARALAEPASAASLPVLRPVRAVYASTQPEAAAAFVAKYFFGSRVSDGRALPGPGNGTCYDAQLAHWERSDGSLPYEMMWIKQTAAPPVEEEPAEAEAPPKKTITLKEYESFLRGLHAGKVTPGIYDEYMDNHIGLAFEDGDPLARQLLKDKVPYFLRGQYGAFVDFFIEGPGGQIYEVLSRKETVLSDIPDWDLCGPLAM